MAHHFSPANCSLLRANSRIPLKFQNAKSKKKKKNGLNFELRAQKAVERHVWTLARPVHREVPQGDRRNSARLRVQSTEVLGGKLAHAIGRDWPWQGRLDGGQIRRVAVDRRGRRVDLKADRSLSPSSPEISANISLSRKEYRYSSAFLVAMPRAGNCPPYCERRLHRG